MHLKVSVLGTGPSLATYTQNEICKVLHIPRPSAAHIHRFELCNICSKCTTHYGELGICSVLSFPPYKRHNLIEIQAPCYEFDMHLEILICTSAT